MQELFAVCFLPEMAGEVSVSLRQQLRPIGPLVVLLLLLLNLKLVLFFARGLIGDARFVLPLQPDMQELSLEAQERKLEREENKNRSYRNCFNF